MSENFDERAQRLGHKSAVVWLTGLSGSGKSTIAYRLEQQLNLNNVHAFVLDGDNVRRGLNSDLGFSSRDRDENIRRVAELAALFADAGLIVIAALISPYRIGRERAKSTIGAHRFVEVYIDVPVDVCEKRDPKGLYRKARRGEIAQFTGVSAPYESPNHPSLRLQTDKVSVDKCVEMIIQYLVVGGFLTPNRQED